MARPSSAIWRIFTTLGTWPLAMLILFEEWGWAPLARLLGLVARLPFVAALERRLGALPPRIALLVFFVAILLLLPVKIGALWLVGRGKAVAGVMILILAKILGTAVVARLFLLTQPQLMRLPWFARGQRSPADSLGAILIRPGELPATAPLRGAILPA
jgi:hypothetical protein